MFKLTKEDKKNLGELFKGIDMEELDEVLDELREYKKEFDKMKEEEPIENKFSRDCSLMVEIKGDEDNRHSEVSVSFQGCKGIPDVLALGVGVLAAIADKFPENRVDVLARLCSLALMGESAGIYSSKEAMLKAEENE